MSILGRTSRSADSTRAYGASVGVLSLTVGATGLVSYAFFSLASHSLSAGDYGRITLLWSAVFISVSVLYRPVEQLLSRTIAERDAHGASPRHAVRVAAEIQAACALLFLAGALALRPLLEDDLFGGSSELYWILVVTALAYAGSYFARGVLAGRRRFSLYGGLQFSEAVLRMLFALAVALGLASGQAVVALGMAAAPAASLLAVWVLLPRVLGQGGVRDGSPAPPEPDADAPHEEMAEAGLGEAPGEPEFTLAHGTTYAAGVLAIMLAEQTFLNAGPLVIKASSGAAGAALAGFAFNALLIARAPLQLFQAVQASILPHLTRLRAHGKSDPFRRSVAVTVAAIATFAGIVALVMLAIGPTLMDLFFGGEFDYPRGGLVLVAVGMGLYLAAATLTQAALARGQAQLVAVPWLAGAALFAGLLLVPVISDPVLRVEATFAAAAAVLCAALYAVYRRGERVPAGRGERSPAAVGGRS